MEEEEEEEGEEEEGGGLVELSARPFYGVSGEGRGERERDRRGLGWVVTGVCIQDVWMCHRGLQYLVVNSSCSPLLDPTASQIQWHNDGRNRCAVYRFNTKDKDQLFCPKCGASLAIDFRDVHKPHEYGVSVSFAFCR